MWCKYSYVSGFFDGSFFVQAALSALKQFSEQGLDPVEGAMKVENGAHEK